MPRIKVSLNVFSAKNGAIFVSLRSKNPKGGEKGKGKEGDKAKGKGNEKPRAEAAETPTQDWNAKGKGRGWKKDWQAKKWFKKN